MAEQRPQSHFPSHLGETIEVLINYLGKDDNGNTIVKDNEVMEVVITQAGIRSKDNTALGGKCKSKRVEFLPGGRIENIDGVTWEPYKGFSQYRASRYGFCAPPISSPWPNRIFRSLVVGVPSAAAVYFFPEAVETAIDATSVVSPAAGDALNTMQGLSTSTYILAALAAWYVLIIPSVRKVLNWAVSPIVVPAKLAIKGVQKAKELATPSSPTQQPQEDNALDEKFNTILKNVDALSATISEYDRKYSNDRKHSSQPQRPYHPHEPSEKWHVYLSWLDRNPTNAARHLSPLDPRHPLYQTFGVYCSSQDG